MPIEAEVEGIGTLEFPDGTPDDVVHRTVKKTVLGKQSNEAQAANAVPDFAIRAIDQAASPTVGLGRLSIEGLGRLTSSIAKDLFQPPGSAGIFTASDLLGAEPPAGLEAATVDNPAKRAVVGAARSAPFALATALAPEGLAAEALAFGTMGLAHGAEVSGRLGKDAVREAAIMAAIPPLAVGGRIAAGAIVGTASGAIPALSGRAIQVGAETLGSFAGPEALTIADLVGSPAYQAADQSRRREMLLEAGIATGIPVLTHVAMAAGGPTMALRFEPASARIGRMLENPPELPVSASEAIRIGGKGSEMTSGAISEQGPVSTTGGAVLSSEKPTTLARPAVAQTAVLPGGAIIPDVNRALIEPPRDVAFLPSESPEAAGANAPLENVGGGAVSFAKPEAMNFSVRSDEARLSLANDADILPSTAQAVAGTAASVRPNVQPTYRPPQPAPTAREYELRKRKESVESGLTSEQPPEIDVPVSSSIREQPAVLSKGQRRQMVAEIERGLGLRPGRKPAIPEPEPEAAKSLDPVTQASAFWTDAVSAVEQSTSNNIRLLDLATLDSGSQSLERIIGVLEQHGLPTDSEYNTLQRADEEINRRLQETPTFTDRAISWMESKKVDTSGQLFDASIGLPISIYNAALDTAIGSVKAGKLVSGAIEDAIAFARERSKGPGGKDFDASALRAALIKGLPQIFPGTTSPALASPVTPPAPTGQPPGTAAANAPAARPQRAGAGPQQPTPAPAPAARPLKGLADAYKIFEPMARIPKSRPGYNSLREQLTTRFAPMDELAQVVRKAYGQPKEWMRDLSGRFEQIAGAAGQGEADILRFNDDVTSKIELSERPDFNAYLFAKRVQDRLNNDPKVKRVDTYTLADAQNQLNQLQQKLTPEAWQRFQDAGNAFQSHADDALQLLRDSGRLSSQSYNAIKDANHFYAPFKVMSKLAEFDALPPGSGKTIDVQSELVKAITGIDDPNFRLGDMIGAQQGQIAMARLLAEKNYRMQNIADIATVDTRGDFVRKLGNAEKPARGKGDVVVMENGDPVHYEVDPTVQRAIEGSTRNAAGILSNVAKIFTNLFRAGATSASLVFQPVNFAWDQVRLSTVSRFGIKSPLDVYQYPMDFGQALLASISGNRLIPMSGSLPEFLSQTPLYRDFLDSGSAGATLQRYLTPKLLRMESPASGMLKATAKDFASYLPRLANTIEETTKIMGVIRAMRAEGVGSGAELLRQAPEAVSEVRRYAGSPDFSRMGVLVDKLKLNLIFMFSNARIQGTAADMGRAVGATGGKDAMALHLRAAAAIGLPTATLWAINQLYKEDYGKLSQRDKLGYFNIPRSTYIVNDQGERVRDWTRLPKKDFLGTYANFVEAALDFAQKHDPQHAWQFAMSTLEDLAPINITGRTPQERLESVVSGMNPMVKAPVELATGRSTFTHRDVIPERMKPLTQPGATRTFPEMQFTDRTPEIWRKLSIWMPDAAPDFMRSPLQLENLTRNLSANLITQFIPTKPVAGRSDLQNNRFLKRFQASGYIDDPAAREALANMQAEQARDSVSRDRAVRQAITDHPGDIRGAARQLIGQYGMEDERPLRRLKDLTLSQMRGVKLADQKMLQLAPRQRAELIASQISEMDQDNSREYLRSLAKKQVLTEETAAELIKLRTLIQKK